MILRPLSRNISERPSDLTYNQVEFNGNIGGIIKPKHNIRGEVSCQNHKKRLMRQMNPI